MVAKANHRRVTSFLMSIIMIFSLFSETAFSPLQVNAGNEYGIILDATPGKINLGENGTFSQKKFEVDELKNLWQTVTTRTTREGYAFTGWYDEDDQEFTYERLSAIESLTENITLTAGWELGEYSVVIPENQHGTITADTTTAKYGDTVTITVEPDEGYILQDIRVLKSIIQPTEDPTTFAQLKSKIEEEVDNDTEIYVSLLDDYSYNIPTKASGFKYTASDGWVSDTSVLENYYNNGATAFTDEYIQTAEWILTEEFSGYYYFIDASKVYEELTQVGTNPLKYTFTMPGRNPKILATFKALPTITFVLENCNVIAKVDGAEATFAKAGKTVTLEVKPNVGYKQKNLSVTRPKGVNDITKLDDLVELMGNAEFMSPYDPDALIKVDNGNFAYCYEGETQFTLDSDNLESLQTSAQGFVAQTKGSDFNRWKFLISDGIITEIKIEYFVSGSFDFSENFEGQSTGTLAGTIDVPLNTTGTNPTFIMPDANVTVSASFVANTYTISYVVTGGQKGANSPESYTPNSNNFDIPVPTYDGTTYVFDGWTVYNYGEAVPDLTNLDYSKCIASNIMNYTVKKGSAGNLVFEEVYNDAALTDETEVQTSVNSDVEGVTTPNLSEVATDEVGETDEPVYVHTEIKIETADENNADEVSESIQTEAGTLFKGVEESDVEVKYINMDITKYQTKTDGTKLPDEAVTDIKGVIEIGIPFESLGYETLPTNFGVVREHGTRTDVFSKISARTTESDDMNDATFYADNTNGILYIYSRYFSTFAIVATTETIFQVALDVNGGNALATTVYNVASGGTLSLPTPTRTNYTFDGWYTLSTGGNKVTSSTAIVADMTLYAHWTYNNPDPPAPTYYTVTFESNGGSSVTSQSIVSGGKVTKPTDPTKEGFAFVGWYTNPGLTTVYDFNSAVNSNLTLYAKWNELPTFTVTFESNGGSSVSEQKVVSGKKATKPEDPTKEGFTFDGWYSDVDLTTEFDFNTSITSNTTLYAKWKENSSVSGNTVFTVTFESNGGSSVSAQEVVSGNKATKPENPTKEGFTFVGWYSDVDLTTEFDFNSAITTNITLYAKWKEKGSSSDNTVYTVTFDSNGGSSVSAQEVASGSKATKPEDPTKEGFTFVGWYVDGSLSTEFDFDSEIVSNVTLYAKWRANEHNTLYLKANVTNNAKKNSTVVKLSWSSVKGTAFYEVYGNYANERGKLDKVATLKKKSYTIKDLEWNKEYVYLVKAIGADGSVLMQSLEVSFVTGTTDESNAKSITAKTVRVRMKQKVQIEATVNPKDKDKPVYGESLRYFSSNTGIAEVDDNGVVTGKAVGTAYIYVYASNGIMKKVTVKCFNPLMRLKATVKENTKKQTSKVTLTWANCEGAVGYNIYTGVYGTKLQKIATVKKNKRSFVISDFELGNEYGIQVLAVNAEGTEFWTSNYVRIAVGSEKTNAKSVKETNKKLSVGETAKLNPVLVGQDKDKEVLSRTIYYSLQPNVATVDDDGVITAVSKGKATVYIFTSSGAAKIITVTVK